MEIRAKKIGFVITGAFSLFRKSIEQLDKIVKEGAEVIPIMSYTSYNQDTKFGKSIEFIEQIQKISRKGNYTYNSRC